MGEEIALIIGGNLAIGAVAVGSAALIVRGLTLQDQRIDNPPRIIPFPKGIRRWLRKRHYSQSRTTSRQKVQRPRRPV
jgi:hypothetical protein